MLDTPFLIDLPVRRIITSQAALQKCSGNYQSDFPSEHAFSVKLLKRHCMHVQQATWANAILQINGRNP